MDTIETNANSYIFQVDNDLVHCASIVQEYIQTNTIPGMLWPAQSPDANSIDNIWLLLKNKLKFRLRKHTKTKCSCAVWCV